MPRGASVQEGRPVNSQPESRSGSGRLRALRGRACTCGRARVSRKNTIAGQISHPLTDHGDGDQAQEHGARAGNGGPRACRLGHSKSVGEGESVRARAPCHSCGGQAGAGCEATAA